jgi:hypothetical protein
LLAASLLNTVRTFHGADRSGAASDDANKSSASFAVCNMFVDENGTVAVEKTMQVLML